MSLNMDKEEIIQVASKNGISYRIVSEESSFELIRKVLKCFTINSSYTFPLWENLVNSASIYDPNGWNIIEKFNRHQETLLFLEPDDQTVFFAFKDFSDVVKIISESYGFVFYLTNLELTYVICFNDHNYLIASGEAKNWLLNLSR